MMAMWFHGLKPSRWSPGPCCPTEKAGQLVRLQSLNVLRCLPFPSESELISLRFLTNKKSGESS